MVVLKSSLDGTTAGWRRSGDGGVGHVSAIDVLDPILDKNLQLFLRHKFVGLILSQFFAVHQIA